MRDRATGRQGKSRNGKRESNKPTSDDFKNAIRKQLDSAASSSTPETSHVNKYEEEEHLTPAQKQQRMRQLELIEEGNFRQQNFKSSLGSRQQKKKGQVSKSEKMSSFDEERDRMLFGPPTKPSFNSQLEKIEVPKTELTCLPKEAAFLIHPNVMIDVATKELNWKNTWLDQRKTLGF